jgi:hypothetical protein
LEATREGLSEQIGGLTKQVAILRRDLETKQKELHEAEEGVKKLKKKYERAFNKGRLQQTGVENIDLRFKVDSAEMKQKVAEGKLEKQIRKNRLLEERCEKIERYPLFSFSAFFFHLSKIYLRFPNSDLGFSSIFSIF